MKEKLLKDVFFSPFLRLYTKFRAEAAAKRVLAVSSIKKVLNTNASEMKKVI